MQLNPSINSAITAARAWLDDQLAQTENLRPMLAAAAGVVFVGLLIAMIGLTNDRVRSLHAAQLELARLKQQLAEGSWAERKQQSDTLRFQLSEKLWTAETAGLAEASFESWLRDRIESKGPRPDSIRIQRAALSSSINGNSQAPNQSTQRMTAKIVMRFEPEALLEILNTAFAYEKILVVDRLLIRSGRNPLIEMDISTFVVLPEGQR